MNSSLETIYESCIKQNFSDMEVKKIYTIRDIKLFVYNCLGLTEEKADGRKFIENVTARQMAMTLAYKYRIGWSQEKIGREIGGKDHAIICHSIKAVKNHCDTEKEYKMMFDMIEEGVVTKFNLTKK